MFGFQGKDLAQIHGDETILVSSKATTQLQIEAEQPFIPKEHDKSVDEMSSSKTQ